MLNSARFRQLSGDYLIHKKTTKKNNKSRKKKTKKSKTKRKNSIHRNRNHPIPRRSKAFTIPTPAHRASRLHFKSDFIYTAHPQTANLQTKRPSNPNPLILRQQAKHLQTPRPNPRFHSSAQIQRKSHTFPEGRRKAYDKHSRIKEKLGREYSPYTGR